MTALIFGFIGRCGKAWPGWPAGRELVIETKDHDSGAMK